jgi:hypothetical protein
MMANDNNFIDPSITDADRAARRGQNATLDALAATDPHLPLPGVCQARQKATRGMLMFIGITLFCLFAVIFGTSAQSLTGLKAQCASSPPEEEEETTTGNVPGSAEAVPPPSRQVSRLGLRRMDSKMRMGLGAGAGASRPGPPPTPTERPNDSQRTEEMARQSRASGAADDDDEPAARPSQGERGSLWRIPQPALTADHTLPYPRTRSNPRRAAP